jgi:hypothetical protein
MATNCNLSPILAHPFKLAQDTIYFSSPEYKKKKKKTCASYETKAFHQRVFFPLSIEFALIFLISGFHFNSFAFHHHKIYFF